MVWSKNRNPFLIYLTTYCFYHLPPQTLDLGEWCNRLYEFLALVADGSSDVLSWAFQEEVVDGVSGVHHSSQFPPAYSGCRMHIHLVEPFVQHCNCMAVVQCTNPLDWSIYHAAPSRPLGGHISGIDPVWSSALMSMHAGVIFTVMQKRQWYS